MLTVVIAVVTGLVGVVLGWSWKGLNAAKRIAELASSLKAAEVELAAERQGRADDRAAHGRLLAEKDRTLHSELKGMMSEMCNLTAETLAAREKTLAAKNEEQVRNLLEPMHQRLDDFRKAADESRRTNGELGVKIENFFKGIRETSQSFGVQAKSFTDALTGANKKQGNWGEAILARLLESCGLKEGDHFIVQTGSGVGIPDCQIFDPAGAKILIVDSKMSWTKYEESYRLAEGPERSAALKEHVASVKRHIDELAKADYPARQTPPRPGYTYVPLTAMFVPCDAALAAALESDPALVDYAFKHDVALVSPLSLFGFLQLVSRAWSRYNVERNTNAIYEEAKKLVVYVDRLFRELEDLGGDLAKAQAKYADVVRLAAQEPSGQCIKGPALRILKLGAQPERELKSKTLAQ